MVDEQKVLAHSALNRKCRAMAKRINASIATRGEWYRTKTGNRIKLMIKAGKRMGWPPTADSVPYLHPANSRAKSVVDRYASKGWLPGDYKLLPIRST